jgi:methyl-accepting chemotaxis protein
MGGRYMSRLGFKVLKMVVAISLISMVMLVVANVIIFDSMFSKLQADAFNVVEESVSSIDGDKLEKVINEKSMDSKEYREIQESMIIFKNDQDIKYFYTMAKGEDGIAYIIVDASLTDASPLGEEYDLEDEMIEAFNGKTAFTKEPSSDEYGTFISAYAPIENSSGDVIAIAGVDKDVASFVSIKSNLLLSVVITAIILIVLSVIMSVIFSNRTFANVKLITNALKKMSNGDLTEPLKVNSKDEIQEIAESINDVRVRTAKTLGVLKDASMTVMKHIENLSAISEEMASSSEQVAGAIQDVAQGTNSQAEEIANINGIMNDFGVKLDETVEVIESISSNIKEIDSNAQVSNNDLKSLEDAIKNINFSFVDVRNEIKALGGHLSKVSEITNLINGIAEQTNLLSLNAAIEAARAGEAGRGFSVVADEIRKLAEQSKTASSNISNLIEDVISKSDMAIKTSDVMNDKLNEQIAVIDESMSSFKGIIESVEEILPKIADANNNMSHINTEKHHIIKSVEATASVAEQVSASAEEIASSSQELTASSQEVSSSAQDLNNMSQNMMNAVNQFKI